MHDHWNRQTVTQRACRPVVGPSLIWRGLPREACVCWWPLILRIGLHSNVLLLHIAVLQPQNSISTCSVPRAAQHQDQQLAGLEAQAQHAQSICALPRQLSSALSQSRLWQPAGACGSKQQVVARAVSAAAAHILRRLSAVIKQRPGAASGCKAGVCSWAGTNS